MDNSIFSELSLVIVIGTLIALVMRIIKQPLIIGYILTGIIVGPSAFHLVKSHDTIEVFSNIGIALLLFIIGLGLNPRVIREVGKVAAVAGASQVLLTAALGIGGGMMLGFTRTESLFLGIALSFSSTIIILKLLSDKKEQNRLYGKVATGLLLIQDVLATLALLFVTSQGEGSFSASQLGTLALKGIIIAIPLFIIGTSVLPRFGKLIAGSQEFLFLFALGWGFGGAALFEKAGFSLEIGALVAGVALAGLPYTQEISARLRPLRDFFVVVFFISLGTRLTFEGIGALVGAIVVASAIAIVLKPLIVMIIMGLMGYTKRTSFKTAVTMGQVSEFSLIFIILGQRAGYVSEEIVSLVTFTALVSIAASSYLIVYSDKLFTVLEKYLKLFERRHSNHAEKERREHYDLVLFGYQKGGHEFIKVFKSLKKRFVIIDYDPEIIDTLERQGLEHLYGDATDIELLQEAGLEHSKLLVSTLGDHETNIFLLKQLEAINSRAVIIMHADTFQDAAELYELGASYVVIPHYIGTEKIGGFIRRSELKKSEFKKYREEHLLYLQTHIQREESFGT